MTEGCPIVWLIFFFAGALFFLLYLLLISAFARRWCYHKGALNEVWGRQTKISLIVAYRNEADFLPAFVDAIKRQEAFDGSFELIAVNDHSDDGSEKLLSSQAIDHLIMLNAKGHGKKNALREAIEMSRGELIVTSDADCIPPDSWLKTLALWYQGTGADMLVGPVKMIPDGSFSAYYDSIDYYSLQMSGAGAVMLGKPVFCSAANLAFTKAAWDEASGCMDGAKFASGDDVFLLHAFKKLKKSIVFVSDKEALVQTPVTGTVRGFFRQRVRWGGKSPAYKDSFSVLVALSVLFANLWLLALIPASFCRDICFRILIVAFTLKLLADYSLLKTGRRLFSISYPFAIHLLFSMIYPFVLCLTAFGALMLPARWKGRA